MSKVSVFDHAWIDLVFEGRNQSYGAYQLRRQDSKTTLIALFSGIALMVGLVGIPTVVNYFKDEVAVADSTLGPTVIEVSSDKLFKVPEPPKPVVQKAAPAAAAPSLKPTIKYTKLVATSQPVVAPPTITQVQASTPSTVTSAGTPGGNINSNVPVGVPEGNGINTTPVPDAGEGLATTASVDVMPMFPGGMARFYKEVGSKFRTPEVENATTLKVYVSFVIEKDGTMTNVKVIRDPGHGMGAEALRVLQSIKTKWTAGKIKGNAVRTAYNLPITVNVN